MTARSLSTYQVRKCQQIACGLRFPCGDDYTFDGRCPRCGAATELVQLVTQNPREVPTTSRESDGGYLRLEGLLDNVRSAWNVGSIFRSADGAGFRCMHLCGITPTPEYSGVLKTSLGAEKSISWVQYLDSVQAAQTLVQNGRHLIALENDEKADVLYDFDSMSTPRGEVYTVVLVVGSEVYGVDPQVLELCERVLYLPMHGMKRSYNVAVAFGIAAHYLSWLADQMLDD